MKIVATNSDVVWNYVGTAVSLGSSFIMLPFLVAYLNGNELGLWYVFLAVGAFVSLFEFGFTPTFARNFAFCWSGAQLLSKEGASADVGEVNPALMATLLSVCKKVYFVITVLAAVIMGVVGTAYITYISSELPFESVVLSWVVFCLATLLNLYFLYFGSLIRGIGKIGAENKIKVASRVVQLLLTAALLAMGTGLLGASLGYLSYSLFFRIASYFAFWRDARVRGLRLKEIKVLASEERSVFSTVSHNAFRDGFVMLSNYVSLQAGTIICSLYLGLVEAGAYSIAMQLAAGVGNFSMALINSYRPMMQSAFQRNDKQLIKNSISKGAVAYIAIYVLGTACVLLAAYPLLSVFKPDSHFQISVYVAVALYMFLFDWHSLFASVLANFNQIPYVKAYFITSVICVVLSLVLVAEVGLGVWGLIAGMALPQLMYNNWVWPCRVAKETECKVSEFCIMGIKSWRTVLASRHR